MAARAGATPAGARPRRRLQCQKLAAEPKPEPYPQMNPPPRMEQQALPAPFNSPPHVAGHTTDTP